MPLTLYAWRTGTTIFTDGGLPAVETATQFSSFIGNLETLPVPPFSVSLTGYADGDIDGAGGASTDPAWDGTLPLQYGNVVGPSSDDRYELFSGWQDDGDPHSIDGKVFTGATCERLDWSVDTDTPWRLTVGGDGILWQGEKAASMTGPEGVYTKTGGSSAGPATLTVGRI